LKNASQKQCANIEEKKYPNKKDESIFVAALFVSMNDKEWYINSRD